MGPFFADDCPLQTDVPCVRPKCMPSLPRSGRHLLFEDLLGDQILLPKPRQRVSGLTQVRRQPSRDAL